MSRKDLQMRLAFTKVVIARFCPTIFLVSDLYLKLTNLQTKIALKKS